MGNGDFSAGIKKTYRFFVDLQMSGSQVILKQRYLKLKKMTNILYWHKPKSEPKNYVKPLPFILNRLYKKGIFG